MKKKNTETSRGLYLLTLATTLLIAFFLLSPLNGISLSEVQAAGSRSEINYQSDRDNSQTAWPHLDSDLNPSPEIVFGQLENGIRYVLKENETPEERVSMHLHVQVGSYHEAPHERGIAHFLEHMLFMGSENFEPGELVKFFQRIGMKFGPDVNARTGFFHTIYDIDLPKSDPASISEGLLVLRDYAAGGLIPEEEVNRERPVILSEKRTRDSPAYRTFKETLAFEMPDTRIIERFPIGTREVIKGADRNLIKTFYDTWYRPENLIVVMVGDIDIPTAEMNIQKRFSDIATRTPEPEKPEFGHFTHNGLKPFYHHETENGSTRVAIEVLTRKDQPEDSFDHRKNQLLEQMANQIVNHRLDTILNQPDSPFTSAAISSGYYLRYVRAAEISAECAPEQWEESLGVLESNLRKALAHGFTQSEVNRVKKEVTAQLEQAAKAAPTRENKNITGQFLNDLNQNRVLLLADKRQGLFQPVVDSVTVDQLNNAFKETWSPDHRLVLVTGNADLATGEQSPEKRIISVYGKSSAQAVEAPAKIAVVPFPYLEKPDKPGTIKSKEHIEDLGITRVLFENGVTLFVKKTDFRSNEVLAALRFGNGRQSEPRHNEGLAEISQRVVNLSGLGAMDIDQLRVALAGTNAQVSFSVEENAFSFSGQAVSNETSLLLDLLYAHIKDPAYRQSAYSMAVRQYERQHESLSHAIEGGLQLKGLRFLAGGDTRFGLPDFETLASNELSDIETWVEREKKTTGMELSVVGDIDPDTVITLAAELFGSLSPGSANTPDQEYDRKPVFPEKGRLKHEVPTRMDRALLVVTYPTTDIYDIEDSRRLSILSDIFSDRMRIRIRDELGATYSQGSHNLPSRAYQGYGLFITHAGIAPNIADKIEGEIKKIANDLKNNGVSKDELERAVKPMLAGITDQLRTNNYWLNTVLRGAARHPAQLDWSRTIFMDYASMKIKDINETAAKYLENDIAATMVFYPANHTETDATGNIKHQGPN